MLQRQDGTGLACLAGEHAAARTGAHSSHLALPHSFLGPRPGFGSGLPCAESNRPSHPSIRVLANLKRLPRSRPGLGLGQPGLAFIPDQPLAGGRVLWMRSITVRPGQSNRPALAGPGRQTEPEAVGRFKGVCQAHQACGF
jgi:hypothetical protein